MMRTVFIRCFLSVLLLCVGVLSPAKLWAQQTTPLHLAAQGGKEQVVRLLLEKGADIEARDRTQQTPLHYAAYSGSEKLVRLLLEKGADIEARSKN